ARVDNHAEADLVIAFCGAILEMRGFPTHTLQVFEQERVGCLEAVAPQTNMPGRVPGRGGELEAVARHVVATRKGAHVVLRVAHRTRAALVFRHAGHTWLGVRRQGNVQELGVLPVPLPAERPGVRWLLGPSAVKRRTREKSALSRWGSEQ